jgi:hypothetical protein
MKYLKLFEAFESQKLTKTLGYIDKESRKKFINNLKRVCNGIDFPISKLDDELFHYLPFKKALKLNAQKTDKPCDAKSENEFPEYGIEGEVCQGGKLKRKWGARIRQVVCPKCSGTGVKPEKPQLKWIKFWFSADGEYVCASQVDGTIIGRKTIKASLTGLDLKEIGPVGRSDLKTGDYFKVRLGSDRNPSLCIAFVPSSGRVFALNNEKSGDEPSDSGWQKFGMRYSWVLSENQWNGQIIKLEPKGEGDEPETEIDPYTWNCFLEIGRWGLEKKTGTDLEDKLKDAHFALCLDFEKMKESGFKTAYSIKSEREESRVGAAALQSAEDVKKQNLERYIQQIAQRLKVGDVPDFTRILPRMLGGEKWAFFYIWSDRNFSDISRNIDRLFEISKMSGDTDYSEEEIKSIFNRITKSIREMYDSNLRRNSGIANHFNVVEKTANEFIKTGTDVEREEAKKALEILDLVQRLSSIIYQKITEPCETLEELELKYQKLIYMRNIIRSDRFKVRAIGYFRDRVEYEDTSRSYARLTSEYINQDELIDSLKKVTGLISRV